jgi:glutathione peroxidase
MRTKIPFFAIVLLLTLISIYTKAQGFYDLKSRTIDGKIFNFSELKGKKVLVVNTASRCGFTPQYAELEKIYTHYKDSNFVVIGFPANNFNKQEPGSNEEIKEFCTKNYGVTFPMMEKISVKGDDMDPVYHWLTEKRLNGKMDSSVKWNFQKYLIDENGNLVDVAYSNEKPTSDKIVNWIRK